MSTFPPEFEEPEPLTGAIEEALEGSMRAEQWGEFTAALRLRRERLQKDLELSEDADERAKLEARLDEVEEQIKVLAEEESITRFVEDTVKFSYQVRGDNDG